MTSDHMPKWVQFSARAFGVNFVAFSFVMFSCWFPTGFAATFSSLAFIFALPVFMYRIKFVQLNRFEIWGLALFGWLSLSVFWSEVSVSESLSYLTEYRIYLILPVWISVLALNERIQHFAIFAAMFGALIALVTSYGLGLGWWQIEGADKSLANRIYHGFIMGAFFYSLLLWGKSSEGFKKALLYLLALLVAINVLVIESGRSGYLAVLALFLVFLFVAKRGWSLLGWLAVTLSLCLLSISFVEPIGSRVDMTITNVMSSLETGDHGHTSSGYRLEFYKAALNIAEENAIFGVGVGDVSLALLREWTVGELSFLTDNVHSEFFNMMLASGAVGFALFIFFIGSIFLTGLHNLETTQILGGAMIGVAVLTLVYGLFNSIVKDFGEKHALMIMLSIMGAALRSHLVKPDRVYDNEEGR